MATVQLQHLHKSFRDVHAVHDLNLEIHDQEFMSLLGPSGCGKTTTLNMIAGLETPTSGQILIDNRPVTHVPAARRDIAMVFQTYALYPHMTVERNMGFALKIRKMPPFEIARQVQEASQILGITKLLDRYPRQLSGGQRQRVALGRAIVRNPKVFLLDEPLSNLDAVLRVQMRTELKLIFNRLHATVAYVTHDQAEAMTMSDRVAVFYNGLLQQVDTPLSIYHAPANQFVASFVGNPPMNFLSGSVSPDGILSLPEGVIGRLPDADLRPYAGTGVTVGIRPEDVQLQYDSGIGAQVGKSKNGLSSNGSATTGDIHATVQVVEQLGSSTLAYLRLGEFEGESRAERTAGITLLAAQLPASSPIANGQRYKVVLPLNRLFIFNPNGGESIRTPGRPSEQHAVELTTQAG